MSSKCWGRIFHMDARDPENCEAPRLPEPLIFDTSYVFYAFFRTEKLRECPGATVRTGVKYVDELDLQSKASEPSVRVGLDGTFVNCAAMVLLTLAKTAMTAMS